MSEHYFAAEPSSHLTRVPVRADVWGHRLDLVSASGVFSAGRLDLGTSVLFRASEPPTGSSTLLDLGCGYGVIACALAAAAPAATVWAVDVNERALQLAVENASRTGAADRVRVAAPDAVPDDVRFDQIWSNPPIRVGKQALHALLLRWLPRLAPGGEARLVVGRNLGADSLQRWLREQGYGCARAASAKGFRVLCVHS
ncbi:MAG: methyltransferase [Actinomycetota bacterium]|nr:methyltransferase [Actinomycetota bacterium]